MAKKRTPTPVTVKTKVCNGPVHLNGTRLAAGAFWVDRYHSKDGLQRWCKGCHKVARQIGQYSRKYYVNLKKPGKFKFVAKKKTTKKAGKKRRP